MRLISVHCVLLCVCLLATVASAGIPEPDVILYGEVRINGVLIKATDDVTILAKVGTVEVGSYRMGDVAAAGDNYVLRIRLESVPAGTTPAAGKAQIGQTAQIYIKQASGPEHGAATFPLTDRGLLRGMSLLPLRVDFDNDGDLDEDDFAVFLACITGPTVPYALGSMPPDCESIPDSQGFMAPDLDKDQDVDQDDFGVFQRCLGGASAILPPDCFQ